LRQYPGASYVEDRDAHDPATQQFLPESFRIRVSHSGYCPRVERKPRGRRRLRDRAAAADYLTFPAIASERTLRRHTSGP